MFLGVFFVFVHTPASINLWGVIGLYAIDICLRWYRTWKYTALKVTSARVLTLAPEHVPGYPEKESEKVHWTQLSLDVADGLASRAMMHGPGDWALLCIPEISPFEWHPFSISSAPVDDTLSEGSTVAPLQFTIKDMGPGTWTGKLRDYISRTENAGASLAAPNVYLDGPYGRLSVPVDRYVTDSSAWRNNR